jgi:hypothetical protein
MSCNQSLVEGVGDRLVATASTPLSLSPPVQLRASATLRAGLLDAGFSMKRLASRNRSK